MATFQTMDRVVEMILVTEEPGEDMLAGFNITFDSTPFHSSYWTNIFLLSFQTFEQTVSPSFHFYVQEQMEMFKFIVPA